MENIKPNIGDGATICLMTDRYPCTIVDVINNRVVIQRDKSIRTDKNGLDESQEYNYERDTTAATEVFSLRKNGKYIRVGSPMSGTFLAIGKRRQYNDPSF